MDSKYTDQEWEALDEKIMHPEKKVICPRCGNELAYKNYGSAWTSWCLTEGCIKEVVRGL